MATATEKADCFTTLPRKLKVGNFTYRVHVLPPDDPRLKVDEESEHGYGLTDTISLKVYLDGSMQRENALTVVLHETQHMIDSVFGIDDSATEEHVATMSGVGWFNVWMDNPKLPTWVTRMTREIRRESKA